MLLARSFVGPEIDLADEVAQARRRLARWWVAGPAELGAATDELRVRAQAVPA